ncbi:MAG: AraC family transcriptional regulator [Polyangiaceae bacterium]
MLVSYGTGRFGAGTMRSKVLFERRFWGHVVERDQLVFDARFVPAAAGRSTKLIVYLLLQGTLQVLAPMERRFEGPVAFLLEEAQFEGADGRRPLLFRSAGSPYVAFELRVSPEEVLVTAPSRPTLLASDERTWAAVRRLGDLDGSSAPLIAAATAEALAALGDLGVVRPDLASSVVDGDARFARVWAGVRPIVERFYAMPTLEELSSETGLSLRQLAREVKEFTGAFHLMESGWRDATRRYRFKIAVLGLSAPDTSIADVARAAGYGSTDAMARAFRDAGLPPPASVQAALHAQL